MKEEFKRIELSEKEKEEQSNMISDIKMINKMIQSHKGIADLPESDFKSEYGKKRFNELRHIQDGKPVDFNKDELEIIGKELEESIKDEKFLEKRIKEKEKEEQSNMISDIKMINKMIQSHKGIADLPESDFKSEYGKKRFNELRHIQDGKPVDFNKDELEIIGKELEDFLSHKDKTEKSDVGDKNKEPEQEPVLESELKTETGEDKNNQVVDKKKEEALEKLRNTKIGIVNIKEIADAEARKGADAYMTESVKDLKGFKGFLKKIWKHTFWDGFYRQREVNRIKEEIKTEDNIYARRVKDNSEKAHEDAMKAISDRFISEYDDSLILSKGEERKVLDNNNPEINKANKDIKDLIYAYALGKIDAQAFKNEKVRIIDSLKTDDLLKESDNYADNLFEIAENVKIALDHGAKMEELNLDTNIIIGKAKSSLKTEAHFNMVDKGVNWMKKTKVGQFVSPAVLSTAVGIAYCASTKFLGTKAGGLLFGLTGAVAISSTLAGIKESEAVTEERGAHNIRKAEGEMEFEPGSKRREQIEKFTYQMEKSSQLLENLKNLVFEKGDKEAFKNFTKDDLDAIFSAIAEIDARNSLNSKNRIDLISYDSIGSVEKQRTEMTVLVARAKGELKRRLEGDLNGSLTNETYESYLEKNTEAIERSLLGGEKGITAQDRAFKKYKIKRVAKKVLQTATLGFVIGGTIQEGFALGNDNVQGVYEGLTGSNDGAMSQTPFESAREWISGNVDFINSNPTETVLGGNVFHLPQGTSIVDNLDGTFDIFRGDELISDNTPLTFDADGNLDADSLNRLGESGIVASTSTTVVEDVKEVTGGAKDYLANHPENTSRFNRIGWYDNDTPKPLFDKNELKLWWGGEGNAGIDSTGNYSFDISHMTSDGSFHQNFSVDAQDAMKNGMLKMVFSLTGDTQNQLFELPIGADGSINIDPNSEIGKLFFGVEDGHAVFKGRFAEVVQSFGEKDGVEQIKSLATLEGPGNDSINDVIKTVTKESIHHLDIPKGTQPPWFIPVMARRPLEKLKETDVIPIYYFGGSGFENQFDEKKYEKYRSDELKKNPDAELNQFKEIEDYLEKQGKEYRKKIEEISNDMGPINNECRLSICIPVAGHQEGENIYESLKNYSLQTAKNDDFEIVLFVNRPEKDKDGKKIKPDNTLSEIERFKKDHPEMNIRVSEKVLPLEEANIGHIRKVMNDAVLLRQYNRGKDAPEFFMVSNDADNKGIAPEYVKNFITKFDNYKDIDAMVGQLDWDIESYIRNPLIHIGTRLFQYEGVQSRSQGWHFNSSGANFAFRSSIYAGVGGYSDNMKGGEDTDFGARITMARKGAKEKKPIIYAGSRVSRLFTSSRRAEMVMKKHGLAPIEQWDKGFSAFDDEVRKVDWANKGEKVDYTNKEEVKKLISALEIVINRTIKKSGAWGTTSESSTIARSLGWLGIKYKVIGKDSIQITDATKLIEGLKRYQDKGLEILKKKTKK